MHEGSLAYSTAVTLIEIAKSNNLTRVREVEIIVGELAMIDEEIFMFWLKNMLKGSIYENSNIKLIRGEAKFKCNNCGNIWKLSEVKDEIIKELCGELKDCDTPIHYLPAIAQTYMKCPKCNSRDFEIQEGETILIGRIIGE
jgi:hydrogenase nickel incorporation protein HypA/HybF